MIGRLAMLVVLLLLAVSAQAGSYSDQVVWVYDGDTLKTKNLGKVRLLGIDTPEKEDSPKDGYYLRQGVTRKTLRRVANRATHFSIRRTKGQILRLETRANHERDKYGRLLALVYLPDGEILNRLLVEQGLAAVYRRDDFALKNDFLRAEKKARKNGSGLWKK